MMGLTLASMGNLDTAEDLASAIDSLWSDCLRFRLTRGTARQRSHPGLPI
jgi:hypothetical protein